MNVVREIWSILSPAQKRAGLGLLGWMLVSMVFEMLGIGLMLPALTAMSGSSLMVASPLVTQSLQWLGNPSQTQLIVGGVVTILMIYAMKAVFVLIATWRQARYTRRLEKNLCERMFSTYMAQPWEFHLQRNSAELIRNMNNIGYFADTVGLILNIVAELFILAGIAVVLLFVNPLASVVTGLLAVSSTWFLDRFTKHWSVRWGEVRHEHQALATRAIHQGLGGVKDAKVLGRESQFLDQYSKHAGVLATMAERHSFLTVIPRLWNEMLGVTALCLLTLVMLWQGMDPQALVPALGVFAAAAFRMLPSVHRISMAIQSLRYVTETVHTIVSELAMNKPLGLPPSEKPITFGSEVSLKNISYRYAKAVAPALDQIDIRIPASSCVGIIGTSGAGKSTLVDILLGLLSPTGGRVLVDDVDISRCLRGWQKIVGYVPQSIYLCDDTIRANIAFGVPEQEIDDTALMLALKAAQLDGFISELPDGVNTLVGERGVRLSGGQRQRIGIARALYHDPQVLVLDEATSALDNETEKGVMSAVDRLHGKKTIVIVAHRLSTVSNCDMLYRLEDGRVTQTGTFAEVVQP